MKKLLTFLSDGKAGFTPLPARILMTAGVILSSSLFTLCTAQSLFYGMSYEGGSLGKGAIISFNPTTNTEDTVHSFGRGDDGQLPNGNLVYDVSNRLFYGMTLYGGSLGKGAIISFNPTTNTEGTVHSFGSGDDGQYPWGNLVYDANNGLFYGMTSSGGSLGDGAIISLNPTTNAEDTVYSFRNNGDDGQIPYGDLVYDVSNRLFYGMTSVGGSLSYGAIISFNPTTNTEGTVHSFGSGDDGQYPNGNLVYDASNGLFYGMTFAGGSLGYGAIISFNPTTNAEDAVHSLGNRFDGAYPEGDLVYDASNGLFYGMTSSGGSLGDGAIISFNPTTNAEDTVYSFRNGDDGAYPNGDLVYDVSNELFYGMTVNGGSLGDGAIISFNPTTNAEYTVHSFGIGDDGANPNENLVPYISIFFATASVTVNISCNGGNNGSASATTYSGTNPYTYSWSPSGGTNSTAIGLSAGVYSITVTDFGDSTALAMVTITQPNVLSATASITANVSCIGGNDGNASAIPSDGTSPYTYFWSGGKGTNSTASGLNAETYTVTVQDSCGESTTAFVAITPTAFSDTAFATTNVTCNGGNSGSVLANASGSTTPYTYSWSGGNGTNTTATGLGVGTYTVTVMSNSGCTVTASVAITQPNVLSTTASVISNTGCSGGATGNASASPTGGTLPYTLSWSNGLSSIVTSSDTTGAVLDAGTYTLTVHDSCGATATASVTISGAITITSNSLPAASATTCNGSVSVAPSGGNAPYTYLWSPTGQTTANAIGLCADSSYCCTVTDQNGCMDSVCINIITGIENISHSSNINLFPNPNTGQFTLTGLQKGMILEMYDYTGKMISSMATTNQSMQLNINTQADGVYLIRILDKDGNFVTEKKVIKMQ